MPSATFACEVILCAKSIRCPRDGTPVLPQSQAERSGRKTQLGYLLYTEQPLWVGWSVAHNYNRTQIPQNSLELGMERTSTNSLVPFQSVKPLAP